MKLWTSHRHDKLLAVLVLIVILCVALYYIDTLFTPSMSEEKRETLLKAWAKAVSRAASWEGKE